MAHLCGSASDAAHQQTPSATLTRQRSATLRPRGQPLPLSPLGHRTARGATDERPPTFSSSPCNRQKKERIDNGGTRQRHLRSMDAQADATLRQIRAPPFDAGLRQRNESRQTQTCLVGRGVSLGQPRPVYAATGEQAFAATLSQSGHPALSLAPTENLL